MTNIQHTLLRCVLNKYIKLKSDVNYEKIYAQVGHGDPLLM